MFVVIKFYVKNGQQRGTVLYNLLSVAILRNELPVTLKTPSTQTLT